MGLICNTNARSEQHLIEKAEEADGIDVVDTGDKHWPKAITDGDRRVFIEGRAFLAWGGQNFDNIERALGKVGIYITDIE
jgi:hypothetical protein